MTGCCRDSPSADADGWEVVEEPKIEPPRIPPNRGDGRADLVKLQMVIGWVKDWVFGLLRSRGRSRNTGTNPGVWALAQAGDCLATVTDSAGQGAAGLLLSR